MGRHAAGKSKHEQYNPYNIKKQLTWGKKATRITLLILASLIVLSIIGNLFPQKTNHGAPPSVRTVNVADVLRNNSPNWYVAQHIVAVVRADDGGKSVTLVNSGHGTASAIIPLSRLGIAGHSVMVWHVWTGIISPAGALRVVLPAGTAMYLILK